MINDTTSQTPLRWVPMILRALRMKRDWSLNDAVEAWKTIYPDPRLKIAKNQVLDYELGTSMPLAGRVAMLATLFGVEPNFFYARSFDEVKQRVGQDLYDKVIVSIKERGPTVPVRDRAHARMAAKKVERRGTEEMLVPPELREYLKQFGEKPKEDTQ